MITTGYIAKISETKNNLAKQLESLINNGKTYVIDMTGTCYMRDDVTGEIVEYPFEKKWIHQKYVSHLLVEVIHYLQ